MYGGKKLCSLTMAHFLLPYSYVFSIHHRKNGESVWSCSGLKYLILWTSVLLLENLRSINKFTY